MSLVSPKIKSARLLLLRLIAPAALLLAPGVFLSLKAQQPEGRELVFPVTIQWSKQKAAREYRLQIAADKNFQNVFLDKRIVGERYVASELAPGYYYWRVLPVEPLLSDFSLPIKFFVSGGVVTSVKIQNRKTRTKLAPALLFTKSSPRVR